MRCGYGDKMTEVFAQRVLYVVTVCSVGSGGQKVWGNQFLELSLWKLWAPKLSC